MAARKIRNPCMRRILTKIGQNFQCGLQLLDDFVPLIHSNPHLKSSYRLRFDKKTFTGFFAVREMARTTIFLDCSIGGLRLSWIISLGCRRNLLGTVLCGFGKIHRVVRVEFRPKCLSLLKQSLKLCGVLGRRVSNRGIPVCRGCSSSSASLFSGRSGASTGASRRRAPDR